MSYCLRGIFVMSLMLFVSCNSSKNDLGNFNNSVDYISDCAKNGNAYCGDVKKLIKGKNFIILLPNYDNDSINKYWRKLGEKERLRRISGNIFRGNYLENGYVYNIRGEKKKVNCLSGGRCKIDSINVTPITQKNINHPNKGMIYISTSLEMLR